MVISFVYTGCDKMETRKPLNELTHKPGKVTEINVKNHLGYAEITYRLPEDDDLQYVLAEYEVNNLTTRQAKASVSFNQIKVDGFSDKSTYIVRLYAVNSSEIRSEPTYVEVNPDTPPFRSVFNFFKNGTRLWWGYSSF